MQAFSDRAGSAKKEVGMEDVMLAIQAKATTSFVTPPSQDVGTQGCSRAAVVCLCFANASFISLPKVLQGL